MKYFLPIAIILVLGLVFLLLFRKKSAPGQDAVPPADLWDTGKTGERYIKDVLQSLAGHKQFVSNCYVPKSDETLTEIDLILLHESGIYVIESKNYSGWIFGSEKDKYWTQSLARGRRKSSFYNPIRQNKSHIKWLKIHLDLDSGVPCYSFIVFSDRCELKKIPPSSGEYFVVKRKDLLQTVRENAETAGQRLTREEIDTLYQRLYPLTQRSEAEKALHAETVRQKQKKTATSKPAPIPAAPKAVEHPPKQEERICPRCGGKLVIRPVQKGERTGKLIWGCSNYPKCRFIENIEEETTVTL